MDEPVISKTNKRIGGNPVYVVTVGGKIAGYVWSRKGFSYRGTQGWNRGIRIRDYHPTEWHFNFDGTSLKDRRSYGMQTRKLAVSRLLSVLDS